MIYFDGNRHDHVPLIKFFRITIITLVSNWILIKLIMGEDTTLILDGLKFVKHC